MTNAIKQHTLHLRGNKTRLRPFTDGDISIVWRWNQDAEVLYYAEGDEVTEYTLKWSRASIIPRHSRGIFLSLKPKMKSRLERCVYNG